jgi:two-component system sensor histidine kinase HydH
MLEKTAPGAPLAEEGSVSVALVSPAQPMSCPGGQELSPRHPEARAWPRSVDAPALAYYAIVSGALAATGYSAWRVAAIGVAAAVQQIQLWAWRRYGSGRRCLKVDAARQAREAVLSHLGFFVTTGLTVAVTGGIASPLLPTFATPYLATVAAVGDRRPTRILLAATAACLAVFALLPQAWTGPELPRGVRVAFLVLGSLGIPALLAPVHAMLCAGRRELARAREEMAADALARARGLEQVGAKVAHELKNPLSAVKALVQLGARNPAEAASHDRFLIVEKEIERMQEILREYLSFERPLQEVRPLRVELGPMVADAILVLSARADRAGVRLSAEGEAAVAADPRRLREALLNLVANAIEATPPGGEVRVEVQPSEDGAQIVVRDTGRGMTADVLARLGTPFFTTRDEGTGLGVALARSVVAQHGGSLRYESRPGKGTVVTARLPARPTGGTSDGARALGR